MSMFNQPLARYALLTGSLVGCLTLATGCATSNKREASRPPGQQQQQTAAQQQEQQATNDRTTFVNQMQMRIDQLSRYASDLRTKAAGVAKPDSKKIENSADDMDSLLTDAKKSLAEVKAASPENWIDYKRDVEKSMDRAENEYSTTQHFMQ